MARAWAALIVVAGLAVGGCASAQGMAPAGPIAAAPASEGPAPVQTYEVVRRYPHDPTAFTQGLIYRDGLLYESTGQYPSTIRRVRLEDGVVLERRELATVYFGEGLTDWGDRLISLTWRSQTGFVWDIDTLAPITGFTYPGEGWGLTQDGRRLIMSDGTAELRFLDPESLAETGRVTVTDDGRPVVDLNELEWIDPDGSGPAPGEVWANVWQTDRIARIDPQSGRVLAWVDLTGLLPPDQRDPLDDVLNGIAWDAEGRRLFVTGKNWPALFEIRIVDQAPVAQAAGSPD
ncbi:glutaminyl-peptide cyclotransferase [Brevundimonas sp.]|uniref:glutaminyl-peptide cyclotransferase n=1 Tax=Brevundimonas sp. TaxID=1871086 RepID=UPI0035AE28D5